MPSYKVIKSGHIIEVYEYQGSFSNKTIEDYMKSDKGGRDKEGKEDRKMEYRESVNQKARNKLRRLISANFGADDLFITITFKENMTDIEKANYEFKKFIQKLKRKQRDFLHCSVIEFQKRGAVHYHMICNLRLNIDFDNEPVVMEKERELAKLWGHGFIDIKNIKHLDNVGAYLVKYMSKSGYDERLEGKKRYFFLVPANNPRNWWLVKQRKRLTILRMRYPSSQMIIIVNLRERSLIESITHIGQTVLKCRITTLRKRMNYLGKL